MCAIVITFIEADPLNVVPKGWSLRPCKEMLIVLIDYPVGLVGFKFLNLVIVAFSL